ncbi:glycerophosphodiester phosphodiesterase, partial [Sphingomonas koreensis]|uniref:glycerophosphodiester phosphodiesterase n=1 Tax=Sphingomonas koreensis TaxID=93064 RepID=UPI001000E441
MRIIALGGNRLHAPANSLAALTSAYTGGADALLIGVKQTADGVLVPADDDHVPGSTALISTSSFADLQAHDFSAGWLPRHTPAGSFHYCDPAVPARRLRLPLLDDVIDALPRDVTLLLDAGTAAEPSLALCESRGRLNAVILIGDSPARLADARARRPALRTAFWSDDSNVVAGDADLLLLRAALLHDGNDWTRAGTDLRDRQSAGEWPMGICAVLDDHGADAATLDALAGAAWIWGVGTGSTFDVERLRPSYVHTASDFAGREIDRRQFALGYAKANRFANVHCDDGVHVEIAHYAGPMPGGGGSAIERRLDRLEWDLINVAREWPFYSGGGVGVVP